MTRVNAYPLLIDLGLPVLLAEDRLVPQFEHHPAVLGPAGCGDGVPEAGGELEVRVVKVLRAAPGRDLEMAVRPADHLVFDDDEQPVPERGVYVLGQTGQNLVVRLRLPVQRVDGDADHIGLPVLRNDLVVGSGPSLPAMDRVADRNAAEADRLAVEKKLPAVNVQPTAPVTFPGRQ